jgi:hypothetical protein
MRDGAESEDEKIGGRHIAKQVPMVRRAGLSQRLQGLLHHFPHLRAGEGLGR